MSEMGDRYREAEAIVLKRYLTETGDRGQSQVWKIKQIADDRAAGKDSSVLELHMLAVEKQVDTMEAVKPVVAKLCQEACKTKVKQPVATGPIEPATPPSDPSVHGIDLDWI